MLNWLRRRYDTSQPTPPSRAGLPIWRVTFDDTDVRLFKPDGTMSQIAWSQLGCVGIMTTPDGPAEPDLFWLLQPLDRRMSLVFPMGADGEHELLHEMQNRLPGFDNMTVIEAMSSTDAAGFVVWQPPSNAKSET
jgi:hypothetical protein